jgi:hypothetical protein
MILAERMVLLLLEQTPGNVAASDLQYVMSVLDKRYGLCLETRPGRTGRMIANLVGLYIAHGPNGFRLDEGGRAELAAIHRAQAPFCRKFNRVASDITTRMNHTRSRCNAAL